MEMRLVTGRNAVLGSARQVEDERITVELKSDSGGGEKATTTMILKRG
jgi:hypothetical protein